MTDREEEAAEQAVDDLLARRYREARDAGLTKDEARAFAHSDYDIGRFRWLRLHCPDAETIARIVL
jgi:hypothetical protein